MVIAFAVPFILTAAAGKKRLLAAPVNGTAELAEIAAAPGTSAAAGAAALVLREKEAQEEQGNASGKLTAFLSGTSIPLAEVGDGVFSAGILCYPQLVGTIQLSGGRRHVKKYIWSFLRTSPERGAVSL